jgi:glutathione reductase (NADPH)
MPSYDYDLFVIGAGSGGVRASRMAAQTGARVGICESSRIGGTCVLRGCIPKKLLVYASHYAHDFEDAVAYGWQPHVATHDWPTLIANKDEELDRLNGIYINLLKGAGVVIHEGFGRLVDAHTIRIGQQTVTAETVLIATGGWPFVPDIPGGEHAITSNEALDLPERPRRIIIVGGGYIAVEFANIFAGLGTEVNIVIRADDLLRGFDDDLRVELAQAMRRQGVEIHTRCNVTRVEKRPGGITAFTDKDTEISADLIMFATGRHPNTTGMGLADIGVELGEEGEIRVDEFSKTSVDNIYAIGDVTDRMALTPVALYEGMCFVRTLFGGQPTAPSYDDIATAVFSAPPIGTVGLTESEARKKYGKVDIYKSRFRPLKHTLTKREHFSFMKLIVDRGSDRVVGAHMIGDDAPEIAQGLGIAFKCGATKAQFDATIGIHPTAAEEFVTMRTKEPDAEEEVAEAAE